MAETLLIDFLSPEQLAQLDGANKRVVELRANVRAFNQESKGIEVSIGNAANVKELNTALTQAAQSQGRLTEAVGMSKAAQQEYTALWKRLLKEQDEQAKISAKEQAQAFKASAKEQADAAKQVAADKKQADQEYQALWKRLLNERTEQEQAFAKETAEAQAFADARKAQADRDYQAVWLSLLEERDAAQKLANDKAAQQRAQGDALLSSPVVITNEQDYAPTGASTGNATATQGAQELAAAEEQVTTATTEATAAIAAQASASQLAAEAFLENLTSGRELIQVQSLLTQAIKDCNTSLEGNKASLADGSKSQEEYNAFVIQATERLNLFKAELRNVNAELNGEARAAVVDETSIAGLSAQLDVLRGQYKLLSAEERASPLGVALQGNIKSLDTQVKELDATLGQSQRNVGNYGSGLVTLNGVVSRIGSTITRLIATTIVFSLVGKGIEFLIDKFGGVGKESDKAAKAIDKYNKSLQSIAENEYGAAQQEIAHSQVLATVAADVNESMKNRLRAVAELQKTYPDYFGNLTKEAILQGNVAEALRQTNTALIANAEAQAAQKQFGAAAEKVFDLKKGITDTQKELQKLLNEKSTGVDAEDRGLNQFFNQAKITDAKKKIDDFRVALKDAEKERDDFLQSAKESAVKAGQALFSPDPKTPKTKAAPNEIIKTNTGAADLAASEAELQKFRIQQDADANKQILENDKETVANRIEAAQLLAIDQRGLIKIEAQKEIEIAQAKIKEQEELEAAAKKKGATNLQGFTDEIKAQNNKIKLANEKLASDNLAIETNYNKEVEKVRKEDVQQRLDLIKQAGQATQADFDAQAEELAKEHAAGLYSEKQYQALLLLLRHQAAIAKDQAEVEEAQRQIDIAKSNGDDVTKLQERLNELKHQLNLDELADANDKFKKLKELNDKYGQYALRGAQELDELVQAIFDGSIDAQNARLQKQSDALTAYYSLADKLTDASALNDADNNREKAEHAAELAAKQKQIQDEQAKNERKKAAFDKGVAILEIEEKAAVAAFSVLPDFVLAAIIEGLAQIEVATLLAKPLPAYRIGREPKSRGEYAIVDEAGPEGFFNTRTGDMEIGSSKGPNIRWLDPHVRVIPNDKLRAAMQPRVHDLSGRKENYDTLIAANAMIRANQAASHDIIKAINRNGYRAPKDSAFDNYTQTHWGKHR